MNIRDMPAVNRLLKREYVRHQAPVVDLIKIQTNDPFKILIATILSARTKDQTTSEACRRLFAKVTDFDGLRRIRRDQLEKLIFPVGFYRMKTKHLKELPAAIDTLFEGKIPETVEELCQLPGVGRKTANLVVAVAFEKPAICVDVHVHRISNRLGLVKTETPFETEMALRELLPKRYWRTWNAYVVSYGQSLCTPRRPRCEQCSIAAFCNRVGVAN